MHQRREATGVKQGLLASSSEEWVKAPESILCKERVDLRQCIKREAGDVHACVFIDAYRHGGLRCRRVRRRHRWQE